MNSKSPPDAHPPCLLTLEVNGEMRALAVEDHRTLLEVLRGPLALTAAKPACDMGDCGACAVMVDGAAILSCITLAGEVEGRAILTPEGLGSAQKPSILQQAFHELGAAQCGYCTPGFVIAAEALLRREPKPSEGDIRQALSGNLCRCTGYGPIIAAVALAARRLNERKEAESPSPENNDG